MDNPIVEEFDDLGRRASIHFACDRGNEYQLGRPLKEQALKLFDDNPDLQPEMRKKGEGFLWSLLMERPQEDPMAKAIGYQAELMDKLFDLGAGR